MATAAVDAAPIIQSSAMVSPQGNNKKRAHTMDNPCSPSPSTSSSMSNQPKEPQKTKSKNRRRKRRRTSSNGNRSKQMTVEQLTEFERQESERAERRRQQLLARGVPMAPYNTGQFLKEDRLSRDAEAHHSDEMRHGEEMYREQSSRRRSENADDSEEDSHSAGSFDREFETALHDMRYEKLSDMTKEQLIDLVMEVESNYEEQTREVAELRADLSRARKTNKVLQDLMKHTVGVRRDSTKESGHESN